MKRNWIARWLGEVLRAALDTLPDKANSHGDTRTRLAMLIDLENTTPARMDEIMSRANRYGEITHRLAFGPNTEGKWGKTRRTHAIRWGRQSHVKTGKNSADIELAITAMELLQDHSIGGFCIVSSDSDFTPLAMRLREAGRLVVGFGEKKAPTGFVEVCDRFELLDEPKTEQTAARARTGTRPDAQNAKKPKNSSTVAKHNARPQPTAKPLSGNNSRKEFLTLVTRAAAKAKHHDGWIHISVIGNLIRKIKPGIRYQDYGHKTLTEILETCPETIEMKGAKKQKLIRLRA